MGSVGVPKKSQWIRHRLELLDLVWTSTVEASKEAIKKKAHATNGHNSLGCVETSSLFTAAPRRWRALHEYIILESIVSIQEVFCFFNLDIAEIHRLLLNVTTGLESVDGPSAEFIDRVDGPVEWLSHPYEQLPGSSPGRKLTNRE